MTKTKIFIEFILPILGIIISFRVFNILNPYLGIFLGIISIYFLISNSIKQIKQLDK